MTKLIIALTMLASSALAQTTIIYSWNLQASPTDTPVAIKTTQDAAVAGQNFLFSQAASGVSPTTLTASVDKVVTTFALASTTGLSVGNGVCLSPLAVTGTSTCLISASTSMVLSAGEIALVTAINGLNVTVKRGSIGTVAAWSTGQVVTFLKNGSFSEMCASIVRGVYVNLISNPAYGSASALAAKASVDAANAALAGQAVLPK